MQQLLMMRSQPCDGFPHEVIKKYAVVSYDKATSYNNTLATKYACKL